MKTVRIETRGKYFAVSSLHFGHRKNDHPVLLQLKSPQEEYNDSVLTAKHTVSEKTHQTNARAARVRRRRSPFPQ